MRFISMLVSSAMCFPFAGCGGDGGQEAFDTLQLCFDNHHVEESLSVHDSIVVCCLEHPIAGVHPSCGDTAAACRALLGGTDSVHNLSTSSATAAEVMTACTDYITEKTM